MTCGLRSKMNLRRVDSGPKAIVDKEVDKGDHSLCLETRDVNITPGTNTLTLTAQVRNLLVLETLSLNQSDKCITS